MNENNSLKISEDARPEGKSYSDLDRLGLESARQAFLKVIKKVEPPLTIGLYGPWGSGKSRMIEGLKEGLQEDQYLVLIFDAWKYRHEQNLVLPLICALQREHLSTLGDVKDSAKKVVTSAALVMANQFLKKKVGVDIGEVKMAIKTYEDGYKHYKRYDDNVSSVEKEYKKFCNYSGTF